MGKRVYQVWKGSNKFFLGGRLIFGPDASSLLLTMLLVIVPVVLFCIFVAHHLRHEFSPYYAGHAILVVTIAFTLHVLVLLLLTSSRDPGIVPRNTQPPLEEIRYESSSSLEMGRTPSLQFPRTKEVMVNGLPVRVKYCDTCMLYRPPRCSHCSICDNCVERFDHHCPWVGQCIGLRNYRYFFCFVTSATALCIFVLVISALYIKLLMNDNDWTVSKALRESPVSGILMAYCFISLWFVGGLSGFHSYLISTNQTTYENFRYRNDERLNVYDRGCSSNFLEVFCTKVNPSKNKFRAFVQEAARRPTLPMTLESELEDSSEDLRVKMASSKTIGGDRLKVSPVTLESEVEDSSEDRQLKMASSKTIGGDRLKVSRRHVVDDIEAEIGSKGSDVPHYNSFEIESVTGSNWQSPVSGPDFSK